MATVPNPAIWTDKSIPNWKTVQTEVFDPIYFLMHRPMCYVKRLASQSIPSTTTTVFTWDSVLTDTEDMWSSTATPTRVTPKTPGRYKILWGSSFSANASGRRMYLLHKNGSEYSRRESRPNAQELVKTGMKTTIYMNGTTDYLEVAGWQDSGSTLSSVAVHERAPQLYIRWESVA